MKVKDELQQQYAEYVQKNSEDGYSKAVVTYTERWAELMEAELAQGKTVAEVAERCSHKANEEGITGFMYGCAVSALRHYWVHGVELAKWHNRQYLPPEKADEADKAAEEGKTVNPAIITVEG